MTIDELITYCDETRPNQYTNEHKIRWINEVEYKVVNEVINKIAGPEYLIFEPYSYDKDKDTELLVPDQFDDVYITYIYSKVDFTNAEMERYTADAAMFSAAWSEFAAWARREYKPLRHHEPIAFPPTCGQYSSNFEQLVEEFTEIQNSISKIEKLLQREDTE